jgi:hypothetical protein
VSSRAFARAPLDSPTATTQLESIASSEEFSFEDVEEDGDDIPDPPNPPEVQAEVVPNSQPASGKLALDILHFFAEDTEKKLRYCTVCS